MGKGVAMDFDEWLKIGIDNNWCGAPVCETHDGLPMSEEEEMIFIEGNDPCIHILRLYEDENTKMMVEENHSPSQWRRTNRGL
jgi:hypothetical protein